MFLVVSQHLEGCTVFWVELSPKIFPEYMWFVEIFEFRASILIIFFVCLR